MKKYIAALSVGFILWVAVNMLIYTKIADFVLAENNTLYLHLYNIFFYLIVGILIGWMAKTNGWILGFIFSVAVIMMFILPVFTSDVLQPHVNIYGKFNSVIRILISPTTLIIIISSVLGGYLGSRINARQIKKAI